MNATGTSGAHIRTTLGSVLGRVENGLAVFRGLPFARQPVGELPLAAPVPVERWDGVREAVNFGPPPPQSRAMGAPSAQDVDGDWLTVNVWSPDTGAARLPVMVWIHGGGYVYGWSGDPLFDGATLARAGVVVVTFDYRLSAEGFGHFAGAPANRGLLDQVAALRWVRDNIAPGWPTFDPREHTWIVDTKPAVTPYPEETSRSLWAGHPFAAIGLITPATGTGSAMPHSDW